MNKKLSSTLPVKRRTGKTKADPKYVTLTLDPRDFRFLMSGCERDFRFSSGKGTWNAKRRLQKILTQFNETLEKIAEKPEFLLQSVANISDYDFVGAQKNGDFLVLHWKKIVGEASS